MRGWDNYTFLTQKERDNETGLDYFKARYYSSSQGRFTSADVPFADQHKTDPSSWNSYVYVRNNPCNRTDPNGRCSPPPGLKPGQVGICVEAFIAAEKFGGIGYGDNRTFSGNNEKLSSKFSIGIIAERTPGDSKTFTVAQKTKAGVSTVDNPLYGFGPPTMTGPPLISKQGTADTTLNGQKADASGSSQTTVAIGSDKMVNFNVSTTAVNAFSSLPGTIRSSLDLTINSNTGQVGLAGSSQASGYPSFAIYSYVYDGKNIRTTEIIKQDEGSPGALREPMKPLPEVKPR